MPGPKIMCPKSSGHLPTPLPYLTFFEHACARWVIQAAREAVSTGDCAADPPSALPSPSEMQTISSTALSPAPHGFLYLDTMLLGNMLPHGAFHLSITFLHHFYLSVPPRAWTLKGARTPGSQGSPEPTEQPLRQWPSCSMALAYPRRLNGNLFPSCISPGAQLFLPASLRFSPGKGAKNSLSLNFSAILMLLPEILKFPMAPALKILFPTSRDRTMFWGSG